MNELYGALPHKCYLFIYLLAGYTEAHTYAWPHNSPVPWILNSNNKDDLRGWAP
jgi:hypothetical protein